MSDLDGILNKEFEILDIINCHDLDVYLKVLMLSDEKTAHSIRGEINHIMQKYINADQDLKIKLQKNNYINFNHTYLTESLNKVKMRKISYYKDIIRQAFIDLVNTENDIFSLFPAITQYFRHYDNFILGTYRCKIPNYSNFLAILHANVTSIAELLKEEHQKICAIFHYTEAHGPYVGIKNNIIGFDIRFVARYELNDGLGEIPIVIDFRLDLLNVDDDFIIKIFKYFAEKFYIYDLNATLKAVAESRKKRLDN